MGGSEAGGVRGVKFPALLRGGERSFFGKLVRERGEWLRMVLAVGRRECVGATNEGGKRVSVGWMKRTDRVSCTLGWRKGSWGELGGVWGGKAE